MRLMFVVGAVACPATACTATPGAAPAANSKPATSSAPSATPARHASATPYAGSMSASPEDLAQALADHGARIGMELDINPEWVQLDVASRPGGPLTAKVPGQYRPADQYLQGWSRDFITVLGG